MQLADSPRFSRRNNQQTRREDARPGSCSWKVHVLDCGQRSAQCGRMREYWASADGTEGSGRIFINHLELITRQRTQQALPDVQTGGRKEA